jgi:hypothetical protein
MARLYNQNPQDNALKFLQQHYQKRFEQSAVFSQKNVKTKKGRKLGGLVAIQNTTNGIFTATLEMQSLASIHKSNSILKDINWLWKTVLAAALVFAFTTGVGFFYPQYFMHFLIPAVLVLTAGVVFGLLTGNQKNFNESKLAHSLSRIPANEKWLVLTVDSDVMALHARIDILRYQCERKGIGILSVSKGRKVSIVQFPTCQLTIQHNYISHYTLESEIVQFFTTQPAYVPAPVSAGLLPIPVLIKAG